MMYNMGGYKSRYNLGGMDTIGRPIRPIGPQGPVGAPPIPEEPPRPGTMQTGGMYADNTVAGAGRQLGPRQTAVTVFQETDPRLQEQRLKSLQEEESRLRQASSQAVADAERMAQEGEILGDRAALEGMQQFQQTANTIEMAAKAPIASKLAAGKSAVLQGAADAYRIQRAANLAQKAKLATDAVKAAEYADKANKLLQVGKAGTEGARTLGSVSATGAVTGTAAGTTAAGTGSALAAGAKSFLSSGAGLGLVASGLGYGVKKLWADDDPTTFDAGDAVGSTLSGAGTGMAIGSVVPVVGTALGGIVGGLYGLGKSWFGSKKAKREKEEAEKRQKRKIKKAVDKHNKDLMKSFTSQASAVRAGELGQKTYAGYNLGENVIAQMGGMRMGVPRYGYAAA